MKTTIEEIQQGVNIITIPATQYKTNLISIYIKRPLNREEVTMNSLIPYVLRAGTRKFNTQSGLVKALQRLYGSTIGVNVSKMGEKQILSFKLAYTDEQYLEEKIAQEAIEILLDVIFDPFVEKGGFRSSTVKIEKEILGESILAKINNKGAYSLEKMVQRMCQDEPYSIPEDGFAQDLEKIDGQTLYAHYLRVLSESEIDIAVAGNVDSSVVVHAVKQKLKSVQRNVRRIPREEIYKEPTHVREEIESMQVNQGKLAIGYRTNIAVEEDLYVPMMVYNAILGVGTSSKLFKNVREKHSLSYSIGTGIESMKSLLFVRAGVEVTDFERAKKLIFAEIDAMRAGDISADELSDAKMYLMNGIRSVRDSIWSISDYIYTLSVQGQKRSPEEIMERIQSVTVDELVQVADKIRLDTIYFLTNNEVANENQ